MLQSIVDYSRSPTATGSANVGPAIDPMFSYTPNEENDDHGYYWSSITFPLRRGRRRQQSINRGRLFGNRGMR